MRVFTSSIWSLLPILALGLTSWPAAAGTITLDANGALDVSNLQRISLALHNYDSAYGSLPAQYSGPVGTPLLSWRVAILPFLNETSLYNQFDLSKPWNDPTNLSLLSQMPAVFRSPLDPAGSTNTSYVAGVDSDSAFPGSPGVQLVSITDGLSDTILVGESSQSSIPWTEPDDIAIGACPTLGGSGFSSIVSGAVPFAFADGTIKFLPNNIDCSALRGLFLKSDGVIDTSMALDYVISPEPSSLPLFGLLAFIAVLASIPPFHSSSRRYWRACRLNTARNGR